MKKLYIINYNAGNIKSLFNAVNFVTNNNQKWQVFVTQKSDDLKNADAIILPGVGAFPECVKNLCNLGFDQEINKFAQNSNKPLLGICVGMQILSNWGYEDCKTAGLGLIDGEVKKIDISKNKSRLTIPQIGWNNVNICNSPQHQHPLFKNIKSGEHFYFANSYHFNVTNKKSILATTSYGIEIVSAITHNYIYGTQFHPEKSGEIGLKLLENFLK